MWRGFAFCLVEGCSELEGVCLVKWRGVCLCEVEVHTRYFLGVEEICILCSKLEEVCLVKWRGVSHAVCVKWR